MSEQRSALRLGIIGAGHLSSRRIYPCLHHLPVELAAVCDLDRGKAERLASAFGAQAVFTDHQEMLAGAGLDALIICVGPDGHSRLAIEALQVGLPVYTEKPPAVCAEDAFEMRAVSERMGKLCMTGFKKRFAPAYRKAKEAIDSAEFGEPALLSIDYCSGPGYDNHPDDPRSQFLLDFCIHIIDLSRFLFGEVAEVSARARGQTAYAVTLVFRNGALGTLSMTSHRSWDVSCEKVELTGSPGQFITCANSVEMVQYAGSSAHGAPEIRRWHSPSFSTAGADSLRETGFLGELEEFVTCVREGREPESSISSAAETMRLFEAIQRSAADHGAPVVLEWSPVTPA